MKKLFASLLCLALLLTMIPMTALAAEGEGWHYDEATGTLTITADVFGAPWGEELKDSVKKVVYEQDLDSTVLSISEIPMYAFAGYTALEEVVLPEGLKTICSYAFEGCTALKKVYIPADVIEIQGNAFNGCTALEAVEFSKDDPMFNWGSGLQIRSFAFGGCTSLKNIDLPLRAGLIDMEAFRGCTNLESISIPKSLTYIGMDAFAECGALSVIRYEGNEEDWNKVNNSPGMDHRSFIEHLQPLVQYSAYPTDGFADVARDAYYYEAVNWAVENGITSGIGDNLFGSDNTCTRGQVVMFLWATKGRPEPVSTDNPFADVTEGDYFYKAVLWAVENGITNGTSETTFSPNDPCTRAQVVTFLWADAGKPNSLHGDIPFKDTFVGDWFLGPVLWAVRNDITGGTGNGMFSPYATCTRGQVVTFLFKAYG